MIIIVVKLQENGAVFRIFMALLTFSFDSPSYIELYRIISYWAQFWCPNLKYTTCGKWGNMGNSVMTWLVTQVKKKSAFIFQGQLLDLLAMRD
jgi:hypothetical protein